MYILQSYHHGYSKKLPSKKMAIDPLFAKYNGDATHCVMLSSQVYAIVGGLAGTPEITF